MYASHNPAIRNIAQSSARGLELVLAFVFASIRERTYLLPKYMHEYHTRGIHSSWVWGNKTKGLSYTSENVETLYANMMRIIRSKRKGVDEELMMLFLEVPGLGMAKAGFVVQLVAGKAGCIDSHNITRFFGESKVPSWMSVSGTLSDTRKREKVQKYLDFIRTIGGTKFLWDSWCTHIAQTYPKQFRDADHVSQLHLDCVS